MAGWPSSPPLTSPSHLLENRRVRVSGTNAAQGPWRTPRTDFAWNRSITAFPLLDVSAMPQRP